MLERLVECAEDGVTVCRLGQDRRGEVRLGRFLTNPKVTPDEMVATARAHLMQRVAGRELQVIQDTTSLRDDGDKKGVWLHPAIVVDAADGTLLGLLSADFLVRDGAPLVHCNQRALANKESRRWVEATELAADLLAHGARGVQMIADREADLYESFACRPDGVDVLVRAHHDRTLADGGKLSELAECLPLLGETGFDLPPNPARPARRTRLALRAGPAIIARPKNRRRGDAARLAESVALTLVEVREIDPPAGQTPLHWRLLTSRPATTAVEAERIVGLYRQRWQIEQVFRVMKTSGFDIEAVALDEIAPLKNLACATLIAAIQIQQMLHDRDGQANRPMEDVYDPADQAIIETIGRTLQGRTERQKNPHPPRSLAHACWICARLGGWTGYYGKPGPIVLVRGHTKLKTMIEGIKRFGLV